MISSDAHFTTIGALLTRDFPSDHDRSGSISSAPAYFLVELMTSEEFWDDDGTRASEVEEEYQAALERLSVVLTSRWGESRHVDFASQELDDLPDVWSEFEGCTSDVRLWRADQRWIALAVGQHDQELPFMLLAAVTSIDPP